MSSAASQSMASAVYVVVVKKNLKLMGLPQSCGQVFSRTDEEYRPTYELIRQGKMPQSEAMLGRMLNAMLAPGKKGGTRKQRLDGSHLPDYQVVRSSLGLGGMGAVSEPDGWFLKGFMLPK